MNNEVNNKVLELEASLKQSKEFQEYLSLKKIIEEDKELKKMRLNIAHLKKEGKEKERILALEEYNNNPLVHNFYELQEQIKEELLMLRDMIDN